MACDSCKNNPTGKWYQIICTTNNARSVEVLCERCHSPEGRRRKHTAELAELADRRDKARDLMQSLHSKLCKICTHFPETIDEHYYCAICNKYMGDIGENGEMVARGS